MNKNYMYSLVFVITLIFVSYIGAQELGLQSLFIVVIPYFSFFIFIFGITRRILSWSRSAVPFRITTTCGQQESLPWIKKNTIENPSNMLFVFIRMLLEILCFRSLFRNTRMNLNGIGLDSRLSYKMEFFLWFGSILFHYSFLVVILRHFRFFLEPIPLWVSFLEKIDSFFKIEISYGLVNFGLPAIFLSGFVLLGAVLFLFTRRILEPQIRYISLASDFFPLFLIIGISTTGIFMRYFTKIDVIQAKEIIIGLITFSPIIPMSMNGIFYSHVFLVCVLLMYFPFSKLMHSGGVFLTPTRNMTGNSRKTRHINPWNNPVKVHTYKDYEKEFREKMIDAGVPVDIAIEEHSSGKE